MSKQFTKEGVAEEHVNGYWKVRYGEGMGDFHFLRFSDFRPSALARPGARVLLRRIPSSSLWLAYPTEEEAERLRYA